MCNPRCLGGIVCFFCGQCGEARASSCCRQLQPVELAVNAADLAGPRLVCAALCPPIDRQTYSTTKDMVTPPLAPE
jgi:hypothetical protein